MRRDYRNRRNLALIVLLPLLLLAGIIAGGIYLYNHLRMSPPPDPAQAQRDEIADYLASDRFAGLPQEEKEVYLRQLRESGNFRPPGRRGMAPAKAAAPAPAEQARRERIRKNVGEVFRKMQEERAREYCSLPADERQAYLDEIIDRIEARRREAGPHRAAAPEGPPADGPPDGRPRPGRGPTPERMKRHIETTDPVLRAQLTEFRAALRARIEQRRAAAGR